jgi:NhaA family Na+:H+ antiporter
MLAGIGFTVSLFITGLAFDPTSQLAADAKVGVLLGSLVAAILGSAILVSRASPGSAAAPSGEDKVLRNPD